MTEAASLLLAELALADVQVALRPDGQLALTAAPGAVTDALLARVREHKVALADRLLELGRAEKTLGIVQPDPARWHEPFPTADMQAAFAIGDSEALEFHVRPHFYVELDEPGLDLQRYQHALNTALQRQRANLVTLGEDLQLRCLPQFTPVEVRVNDLRTLPAAEQVQQLQARREALSRRTLPLDRWPWFDCEISLHGDGQARLHVNHNTVFGDGYAAMRLLADAQHLHDHPDATLPPLEVGFRDLVLALRRIEDSPLGDQSRRYWLQRVPTLPGPPPVPRAPDAPANQRSWLTRREFTLPARTWAALQGRAQLHGLSPEALLTAAQAEVLARWSGSRHFVLGRMTTHRQPLHPQVQEVFGNFSALYPLEVDWRNGGSFADRARQLQAQVQRDQRHQHCSGVQVLQAINRARGTPGRAPCPFVVGSGLALEPLARRFHACLETTQVMLDHQFWHLASGELWVVWDVIEACFAPGIVDAMWDAYRGLLDRLTHDEATWTSATIDLLPDAQRQRRLAANATAAPLPAGLLHQGLAEAAVRWPQHTAVIAGGEQLSYADLDARGSRIAHALQAAGVQRGDRVAVLLDKGWGQVAAVHGVLRSGAAYVPIDPDWPAARRNALLADVQAAQAVTRLGLVSALDLPAAVRPCCVDDPALAALPATPPANRAEPGDLAYVIFTSGSTGQPKGVMIDHRGALNTVADINQRCGVDAHDVVYGVSSLSFDLSVYDLFGPLAAGATLVLPPPGPPQPLAWLQDLQRHQVTLWNSVPALMQLVLDAVHAGAAACQQPPAARLPTLRTVLLSGDWIPVDLPAHIRRQAPAARVHALGGATEASIWSIHHAVDPAERHRDRIPYGRPLANQRWHVLHDDGEDAPDGVPGALCIAGDGLALGYWDDAERSAAAFVAHPRSGERLYRTGDLGRWRPDGQIDFLGRADAQVKVQGHRIELGEIEHALRAHPGIAAGAALATGDGSTAAGATSRRLVAFAVARPGQAPDDAALRHFLRQRLPAHMVPPQVVWLQQLPLNCTGKVSRAALQQLLPEAPRLRPGAVNPAAAAAADGTAPLQAAIAAIWAEVLGQAQVDPHDDFFALGGQSFTALRVMTRVSQHVGRPLPMSLLLEARSAAALAERVQGLPPDPASSPASCAACWPAGSP